MNEQELIQNIKTGVKEPGSDFTNRVMNEISSIQDESYLVYKRIFRFLIYSCVLLFVASIFIVIPEIQFYKYSIKFSPVIMPIIGLIFIFIVSRQLEEVRSDLMFNR